MTKLFLPLIFIFGLFGCNSPTESTDYLGQSHPDSIPVIFAPDIVSVKGRLEHGISFTPDTQELAFGILNNKDFSGKILYTKKVNKNWTAPIVFEPLKDENVYLPYFSPDGKSMLFAQSRPDADNYITDIWVLNRSNDNWNEAQKLNSPISTLTREASACMTFDNTIYFSSNRDGNGLADLYFSTYNNGTHSNTKRIHAICTERDEESIFVAPDESYIIFSRYATDENGPDLFISYQDVEKNWTEPRALDSIINTAYWERRPFVSIDNKFLFFTKLTLNQSGITESDIYWVNTQKVFKPFVFNPIAEKTIKIGKETKLKIPSDYFKDIDNQKLSVSINDIEWAKFDSEKMTLVMNPTKTGEFDILFTAVDKFSNKTTDRLKIIVEK